MLKIPTDSFKLGFMKFSGLYYMLNLNVKTICNINVYRLPFYVITAITICVLAFGTLGIFFGNDDTTNEVDTFLLICIYIQCYFSVWKLIAILYNVNTIYEIFDVTSLNLIKNKSNDGRLKIFFERLYKIKTMIIVYFVFTLVVVLQWIIFPLINNMVPTIESTNHYKRNILNWKFPVSLETYNQYYIFFYISETIFTIVMSYSVISVDVFIVSYIYMVIAKYEILMRTLENIGHENKPQKG